MAERVVSMDRNYISSIKISKPLPEGGIATHSPILMAYPGAQVYELTEDGIRAADYRETEHYRLTRRFLENPEKMLRYLLEE